MATSKTWSNLSAFEKDTGVRANGVREQVSSCSLPFIIKEWKVDHRKAKHTYDAEGNRRTVPQKSRTLDSVFQDVPYHKIDLHKEWNGRSCNNEEDDDAWPVRFDNISPLKPRPLGKGTYGVVRQFKTIHGQKVAIKSIDVIKPVQLETETIRQCILEPDTINSLHAYHQEQVYPLKQFVDEARYCVFMGRERIGPTVHFVLFSHWPVKHGSTWNVSICMEHFDSNAKSICRRAGTTTCQTWKTR